MFFLKKKFFLFFLFFILYNIPSSFSSGIMPLQEIKNNNNVLLTHKNIIKYIWGLNEILITDHEKYVIYSDEYKTRSCINFCSGLITIETINKNPIKYIRKAMLNTFLMKSIYFKENKYFRRNFFPFYPPFLYNFLFTVNGDKFIRCHFNARIFANYLLKNHLKKRLSETTNIWFININMFINNYISKIYRYIKLVNTASVKYSIEKSLILAIIHTESNFDPYAVSSVNALGLMQIIPHYAGKDVFKMKGKRGQPSKKYLLNPKNNIDIGTAYLYMLKNIYLNNIHNHESRCYVIISSYNSGIKNVLKLFSCNNNNAFKIINNMSPKEVYNTIYNCHPSEKSRFYFHKVVNLKKQYERNINM